MQPAYRADIDGLRAIAVLAVIAFHFDIPGFSGGFVGVDIFFVISGFLITKIIVTELDDKSFSLLDFYERRARRILPALLLVTLASLIAGYFLLMPSMYRELAQSAVASTLFSSNILFFLKAGYFDLPSASKPLLNTWSLGVEEQFYVFFPLLVLLLNRIDKRRLFLALLLITIISLTAAIATEMINALAAFYLIPFRAWELFIGCLLAVHMHSRSLNTRYNGFISISGVFLLATPVFLFDKDTTFPSYNALLPTLGAALIIWGGQTHNVTTNLLSAGALRFVGKISYSLYLWHWPILVYYKLYQQRQPNSVETITLIAVTLILAFLSWKYIEQPFRQRQFNITRRTVFAGASVGSITLICAGLFVHLNQGLPGRASDTAHIISTLQSHAETWRACDYNLATARDKSFCPIGDSEANPTFLLWGDSHALAFAQGLNQTALAAGESGYLASLSACPPLTDILWKDWELCSTFNRKVLNFLDHNTNIKYVYIVARWPSLFEDANKIKNVANTSVNDEYTQIQQSEIIFTGIKKTLLALDNRNIEVVLINSIPEATQNVPQAEYIAQLTGRDSNTLIAPSLEQFNSRNKNVELIFTALKGPFRFKQINPADALCRHSKCLVSMTGQPLYWDDNHLSIHGAVYLAQYMRRQINSKPL